LSAIVVAGGVFREVLVGAGRYDVRLGGSGLHAALAAARLGAEVTLVAPVGEEDVAALTALCHNAGIRTAIATAPGASGTFVIEAHAEAAPRPAYRPAEGGAAEPRLEDAKPAVVLVFGHPEWDACANASVLAAAEHATLLWDRQGWLSRARDAAPAAAMAAARRVQLGNVSELAGELRVPPAELLDSLPLPGFDSAVVKNGRWGVQIVGRSRYTVAAHDVEGQTVGSGDVFAGAFAAAVARGDDDAEACEEAAGAAAAWIASDEPHVPADFSANVRRLRSSAALLPARAPADLAGVQFIVQRGAGVASEALAHHVIAVLQDLGLEAAGVAGNASSGIAIAAADARLDIGASENLDLRSLRRSLADFAAEATAPR
jgi:ribokinase